MEIKCNKCGAMLQYSPGTEALVCEYCGNTVSIGKDKADDKFKADYIIPFSVAKDRAIESARLYMTSGVMTPDDLVREARIESVRFVYFPTYLVSGEYTTHWTASFGYDRSESYREWNSSTKRWEEKSRSVTDWSPASGTVSDNFFYFCPAATLNDSTGFSIPDQASKVAASVATSIDCTDSRKFDPHYQVGYPSIPYVFDHTEAWTSFGQEKLENAIAVKVYLNKQGDRQKDWHWSSKIDVNKVRSTYVPLIQVKFEYKSKSYYCYVNGSNASLFSGTELPVDENKKNLEATAVQAKQIAGLPCVVWSIAALVGLFILDSPANFYTLIGSLALAIVYKSYINHFISSELDKVHANSEEIRKALFYQRQIQDGQITLGDEVAANSFTPPAAVPHKISLMGKQTFIVSVITAVIALYGNIEAQLFSENPKSLPKVNQVTSTPLQQKAPTVETSAPAKAATEPAKSVLPQNSPLALYEKFDAIVLQKPISTSASAVMQVMEKLASLPKPPTGDPAYVAKQTVRVAQLFNNMDFKNAVALLHDLVEIAPADGNLRGDFGYALYKSGLYTDAKIQTAVSLTCNPENIENWRLLQATCRKGGDTQCIENVGRIISVLTKSAQTRL